MSAGRVAAWGLAFGGIFLASRAPAAAFSDPEAFSQPVLEGGGGGRHFTGAPPDGLGCGVCHGGGAAPAVTIEWRDLSGAEPPQTTAPDTFQPGHTYAVALRWPPDETSHALQLELVDAQGAAPMLALPPDAELPVTARCDGQADGPVAAYVREVGVRRIIGVQDCGAVELTFTFAAPATPELYFAFGMVRSNSDGDARGDGVLELRQRLRAAGTSTGGCSTTGAPAAAHAASAALILLMALAHGLRRRAAQVPRSLEAQREKHRRFHRRDVAQTNEREIAKLRDAAPSPR